MYLLLILKTSLGGGEAAQGPTTRTWHHQVTIQHACPPHPQTRQRLLTAQDDRALLGPRPGMVRPRLPPWPPLLPSFFSLELSMVQPPPHSILGQTPPPLHTRALARAPLSAREAHSCSFFRFWLKCKFLQEAISCSPILLSGSLFSTFSSGSLLSCLAQTSQGGGGSVQRPPTIHGSHSPGNHSVPSPTPHTVYGSYLILTTTLRGRWFSCSPVYR